jgi:thiamine transport system substrate-binding protein
MLPVIDLGDQLEPTYATLPQPEKTLTVTDAEIAADSKAWIDEMLSAVQ